MKHIFLMGMLLLAAQSTQAMDRLQQTLGHFQPIRQALELQQKLAQQTLDLQQKLAQLEEFSLKHADALQQKFALEQSLAQRAKLNSDCLTASSDDSDDHDKKARRQAALIAFAQKYKLPLNTK